MYKKIWEAAVGEGSLVLATVPEVCWKTLAIGPAPDHLIRTVAAGHYDHTTIFAVVGPQHQLAHLGHLLVTANT